MSTTLERIQYGFDRASRRTWRRRVLTTGEDDKYGYDGLSQVVEDARGNLNLDQTAIGATPVGQANWHYDPTGNWQKYETRAASAVSLAQQRVHDKGNRLTQIVNNPNPILLDRAGRMLELPPDASGDWDESLRLKWDAWGRITVVRRKSDDAVLGAYAYDGQTRRVIREAVGVVQHSYYSDEWRPLEERKDSATTACCCNGGGIWVIDGGDVTFNGLIYLQAVPTPGSVTVENQHVDDSYRWANTRERTSRKTGSTIFYSVKCFSDKPSCVAAAEKSLEKNFKDSFRLTYLASARYWDNGPSFRHHASSPEYLDPGPGFALPTNPPIAL